MVYCINLRITAPSKDHLLSAIAGEILTETFLNAASGEHDSDELLHPEGNILFENMDFVFEDLAELDATIPFNEEGKIQSAGLNIFAYLRQIHDISVASQQLRTEKNE